jgi:Tfp pilus assembly protein PilN
VLGIATTRPRLELDFARTKPRVRKLGLLLLGVGIVGAALVLLDYRTVAAQIEGLQLRIAAIAPGHSAAAPDKTGARAVDDARDAVTELSTPWSLLLRELELASQDSKGSVAVLGIEPEREKRQVHVVAEARSLPTALTYVERLQQSQALRYPMLESHEVQTKDPEHPVRFQIRADWRLTP